MTDYSGVVMAIAYKDRDREAPAILIELCHADPTKTVTVHASFDGADAGARWRSWATVLNVPLLVQDRSGDLRQPGPTARQGDPARDLPSERDRRHGRPRLLDREWAGEGARKGGAHPEYPVLRLMGSGHHGLV